MNLFDLLRTLEGKAAGDSSFDTLVSLLEESPSFRDEGVIDRSYVFRNSGLELSYNLIAERFVMATIHFRTFLVEQNRIRPYSGTLPFELTKNDNRSLITIKLGKKPISSGQVSMTELYSDDYLLGPSQHVFRFAFDSKDGVIISITLFFHDFKKALLEKFSAERFG